MIFLLSFLLFKSDNLLGLSVIMALLVFMIMFFYSPRYLMVVLLSLEAIFLLSLFTLSVCVASSAAPSINIFILMVFMVGGASLGLSLLVSYSRSMSSSLYSVAL